MSWFSKTAEKVMNAEEWSYTDATGIEFGATTDFPPVRVAAASSWHSDTATIDDITRAVKKSLGYVDNVLVKCRHCGQYGAVYCACPHCGAPIDPE